MSTENKKLGRPRKLIAPVIVPCSMPATLVDAIDRAAIDQESRSSVVRRLLLLALDRGHTQQSNP